MRYSTPDDGNIKAEIKLQQHVIEVLKEMNINHYHIGTNASGDCLVTDCNIRDAIYRNTKALAVDMESGSIAHVARLNHIPFIAIRTISDFADENDDLGIEATRKSSEIVRKLIDTIIIGKTNNII